MRQRAVDVIDISRCWSGLFQPFPLLEPQAVVLSWVVFGYQASAVLLSGSVSKHLHPEAVLKERWVGTLTESVDHKQTTPPAAGPPLFNV